jgi:hypothetical protein
MIPIDSQSANSPIVRFGIRFFGAIMLIATPFVAYSVFANWQSARESIHWPAAAAEIVESRIEVTHPTISKTVYRPRIRYRYRVAEHDYQGDRISHFDSGSSDRATAQEQINAYPVGAAVRAHYQQDSPGQAVLQPGVSLGEHLYLGVPALMLGFGALAFWTARHMGRDSDEPAADEDSND